MNIEVKSFGYGIYSVLAARVPSKEGLISLTGIPVTEIVSNGQTAYAMASSGHEPSKYEISNISSEEWEDIRTAVDAHGSKNFSERLTMLEQYKSQISETNT